MRERGDSVEEKKKCFGLCLLFQFTQLHSGSGSLVPALILQLYHTTSAASSACRLSHTNPSTHIESMDNHQRISDPARKPLPYMQQQDSDQQPPATDESTSGRSMKASNSSAGISPTYPTGPSTSAVPASAIPASVLKGSASSILSPLTNLRSNSQAAIDNRPWTSQDIGQNSIGSVLNDPTSSLSQKIDTVSKQALTAIPKTQLRHIRFKDFDPYIQEILGVYEQYQELQSFALSRDSLLMFQQQTGGAGNTGKPEDRVASIDAGAGAISAGPAPAPTAAPGPFAKSKSKAGRGVESLESIPSIFFEADFNLENPRIFEQVTQFANVSSSAPQIGDRSGATTNGVLQEKLSHYLDTVEVHLVAEISRRSSEFFSALSNIQSLHAETLECLSHIRDIRSSLTRVSDNQAKIGLDIVRKKKRRNNLALLCNTVSTVKEVKKTQPMIQVLLNQGDYVGALDLISETNRVLRGSGCKDLTMDRISGESKPVNLEGIRGLVHLTGQLAEMSKMIGTLMENDFLSLISTDIQKFLARCQDNKQPSFIWAEKVLYADQNTIQSLLQGPVFQEAELAAEEDLKGRLTPLVMGLLRVERMGPALQLYRDKLMKVIKAVTKQVLQYWLVFLVSCFQFFPPPLPEEKDNPNAQGADG